MTDDLLLRPIFHRTKKYPTDCPKRLLATRERVFTNSVKSVNVGSPPLADILSGTSNHLHCNGEGIERTILSTTAKSPKTCSTVVPGKQMGKELVEQGTMLCFGPTPHFCCGCDEIYSGPMASAGPSTLNVTAPSHPPAGHT
ncbi:hypothetical protein T265_04380 [Opisthorchis viverrini]|uniref:Uncharacterized protein n=1 Tax=Opisthorchis viverrini TaxID=6198 RepID=A0A074ZZV3_OPIVI|nr:hypothetical protein T265_04380 [Opisthorchis viverrini]KER28835.1 hypothetical protein T265_04380 [Opisthorchis viverrini]